VSETTYTRSPRPSAFAPRQPWAHAIVHPDPTSAAACGTLGGRDCHALRRLAARARTKPLRSRDRVLLLPGIMGSTLGHRRFEPPSLGDDVLWLDPIEIVLGHLARLRLPDQGPALDVLGVLPWVYWPLRWRLRASGIAIEFHPYDWRRSLSTLGRELAERIRLDPADRIHVIGHSLGGLVARSAIAQLQHSPDHNARVGHIILVGTPNAGSLAALQALRGTLDTVRTLARFDLFHSAEDLSANVFATFPSLCESLPPADPNGDAIDLLDPAAWPATGPRPDPDLLAAADGVLGRLPPADARFHVIAGTGHLTPTLVRRAGREFVYDLCDAGDDTVALASARLTGAPTYLVSASHGRLIQRHDVALAMADLILTGQTMALPKLNTPILPMKHRTLTETELRTRVPATKVRRIPTPKEARQIASRFAAPAAPPVRTPEIPPLRRHIVPRFQTAPRKRPLPIGVACGDLVHVRSDALLLGMFRSVVPDGPAAELDTHLGGAIRDLAVRRTFHANLGEVFLLPTGSHPVHAKFLVLAGLGTFDQFTADALTTAAETALRTALRAGAHTLATALVGARSGLDSATLTRALLQGFLQALADTDPARRFRRLTFCEIDPVRCARVAAHLRSLARSSPRRGAALRITERRIPSPARIGILTPWAQPPPVATAPLYLILRDESTTAGTARFRAAVLTPGPKATVITAERRVRRRLIEDLLRGVSADSPDPGQLEALGDRLARLLLADEIRSVLTALPDRHLVIVHDALASRIPWEMTRLAFGPPALRGGLSRRYLAEDLSVARWLEARRQNALLEILLVVNPGADLEGAEAEGDRLQSLLAHHPAIRITERRHRQATRDVLRSDFHSGRFDVVHYAGHAFFDPADPARSGLYCADGGLLTGRDLAGLQNLPHLVFFNACESGRLRQCPRTRFHRLETAVGLAEAFLRGGVANYVGTYWPVGDLAALAFASAFYGAVIEGKPLGHAVLAARQAVHALPDPSVDWANYLHYGTPDFVLKLPADAAAAFPGARLGSRCADPGVASARLRPVNRSSGTSPWPSSGKR